jgi:hypothetical protein
LAADIIHGFFSSFLKKNGVPQMLEDGTKPAQGPSDGQPFRNPINEGLATSLAIVHVAFLLSLGYNVGTFLH